MLAGGRHTIKERGSYVGPAFQLLMAQRQDVVGVQDGAPE